MWQAALELIAAAAGDPAQFPWEQILIAVIGVFSAVLVAWLALRGTVQTNGTLREIEFDKRRDARLDALEKERDQLQTRLYRCREQLARLRLALIERGFDPDELLREAADAAQDDWPGGGAVPDPDG